MRRANNSLKAHKWHRSSSLLHFAANTSDQRLLDKWLFLGEWVLWPWRKGECSIPIHPQLVSGLLHCNLQKFPLAGNSLASNFSTSLPPTPHPLLPLKRLKVREFQDAQEDNCFLSKGQAQKMHLEFLMITSMTKQKTKTKWINSLRVLIWNSFTVAQL